MRIPAPTEEERDALLTRAGRAERALSALAPRDPDAPAKPTATAGDIWRAAALADPAALSRVGAAAAADPATARAFQSALSRHALASFGALRAADSGEAGPRVTEEGWSIELSRSRSRPGRCFVSITVPAGRAAPKLLFASIGEAYAASDLPAPEDGVIQLVLDETDLIVTALADRRSTLILR
ncbi:MAG: hypothetical protein AAF074_17790 [Pseudomonadota bacterium]